jgi:NADP-dependent 3-hydroxy acid dehydrogenase YdfG
MVETEFSLVRFKGDADQAAGVYKGVTPLSPQDIAECVGFAVSRPPHVNLDYLIVRPLAQANASVVARAKT